MIENNIRVERLYNIHHKWLLKCSFNICKDNVVADEMVSNLYLFLLEKGQSKYYYLDTFNLKYCYQILKTRYINEYNKKKRYIMEDIYDYSIDIIDDEYDTLYDEMITDTYEQIINQISSLKRTDKIWSSAWIYFYYISQDETMKSLSEKLKVSQSKVYNNIRKIKSILKEQIDNPFLKHKNNLL